MQIKNIADLLNEKDFKILKSLDINLTKIQHQYTCCVKGSTYANLIRVATTNDGILSLSDLEKQRYIDYFDNKSKNFRIEKFVPASGAATRMFKFLIEFLKEYNPENKSINAYINTKKAKDLNTFLIGLEKFSFYKEIITYCKNNITNYDQLSQDYKYYYFIKVMIDTDFIGLASKPKALIPFHTINGINTTPLHKHVNEALAYTNENDKGKIHFTVTKGFENDFQQLINAMNKEIEVSYSNQLSKTNSLAFDEDNEPFRQENGELLFRPGGHGALIENLNNISSDIIFIKNIDNVSYNHFDEIVFNKKFIGGLLISVQEKVFDLLKVLPNQTGNSLKQSIDFAFNSLNISIPKDLIERNNENKIKDYLLSKLNRPIRICGMVKNEGEPGGGPFWVKNKEGEINLQIVESSQINSKDPSQNIILSQSTHFNPVDIVCYVKNFKGKKFDLNQYVDNSTGFIVKKTHEGRNLKAYELPGLWNGSMADWITIFVEVPLSTFNPVKTVNDLLKPAHQHA